MEFLARWSTTHRRTVIAAWVVLLLASLGTAGTLKNRFSNNLTLPNTGAQRASHLLGRHFPALAGDADPIAFHARRATLTAPEAQRRIATALVSVGRLPHVTRVARPVVSRSRTIGFATVTFDERGDALPTDAVKRVI